MTNSHSTTYLDSLYDELLKEERSIFIKISQHDKKSIKIPFQHNKKRDQLKEIQKEVNIKLDAALFVVNKLKNKKTTSQFTKNLYYFQLIKLSHEENRDKVESKLNKLICSSIKIPIFHQRKVKKLKRKKENFNRLISSFNKEIRAQLINTKQPIQSTIEQSQSICKQQTPNLERKQTQDLTR